MNLPQSLINYTFLGGNSDPVLNFRELLKCGEIRNMFMVLRPMKLNY